MGYRAYILDHNGHIMGVREIDAPDDDAAIEKAKQYVDGHDFELWERGRLITRLARSS